MKYSFAKPSESLSRRILKAVPYKERFPAGRLKPPVGIIGGDVRSLAELYLFLAPDESSLPGINLERLPDWIERNMGDTELAEAITSVVAAQNPFVESCQKVYEIVGCRLEQARMTIEEDVV